MAASTIPLRILPIRVDLTGMRFEHLTVLSYRGSNHRSISLWNCRCDCGKEIVTYGNNLRIGHTRSCGCIKPTSWHRLRSISHTPESLKRIAYGVWVKMKGRCLNTNSPDYPRYGGRGITICDRWLESFENFWADMGPTYQLGLTLDRENNDLGYSKGNCRWATSTQQNRNRRDNRIIDTPKGRMCVAAAAETFRLEASTLHRRIKVGWPSDKWFDPVHSRRS